MSRGHDDSWLGSSKEWKLLVPSCPGEYESALEMDGGMDWKDLMLYVGTQVLLRWNGIDNGPSHLGRLSTRTYEREPRHSLAARAVRWAGRARSGRIWWGFALGNQGSFNEYICTRSTDYIHPYSDGCKG